MKNLNIENSKWTLVNNLFVIVLSLIAFVRYDYNTDETSFYESALIETFAPIQRGTTSLKETVVSIVDNYFLIVNTSKENKVLKRDISILKSDLFNMSEVQKENQRLKRLLEFGKEIQKKKVLAQVVAWDSSSEFSVLRINKGSNANIKVKDPVITINGVVGYIFRVTPNYSDVLTILDQNNRVDAIVARTRSHGIVEGISKDKCILKYVARTEQVELGDEVISAGLGTVYPKGLKIGRITKVDKENFGITQSIEITPSVDFNKLEEVVIFTDSSQGDKEISEKADE